MAAFKPYQEYSVGKAVHTNYEFLENLWKEEKRWGKPKQTLRNFLYTRPTEQALRNALKREGIDVKRGVRIMLVDIERASAKTFGLPGNPNTERRISPTAEDFYVLVLPPKLRRKTIGLRKEDYLEMQAWSGAWYHATNDGYGM